jgi:hypothetical protein
LHIAGRWQIQTPHPDREAKTLPPHTHQQNRISDRGIHPSGRGSHLAGDDGEVGRGAGFSSVIMYLMKKGLMLKRKRNAYGKEGVFPLL